MSCVEATRRTINGLPARSPFPGVSVVRRCIEPQSGNSGEGMALPRVDRDPFARAPLTVAAELRRTHRRSDQAGRAQHIGDGPGTIVGAIIKRFVTATVTISFVAKLIVCPAR